MSTEITWSPGITLETMEHLIIEKAYAFYRGNKTQTASALGIAIRTLDGKLDDIAKFRKAESDAADSRRIKAEEFVSRSRIGLPIKETEERIPIQSAPGFPEERSLSMPKPEEIQTVLPRQAAGSGNRRAR